MKHASATKRIASLALISIPAWFIPAVASNEDERDLLPDDPKIETIVVTGTRIVRPGADTFYPAVVVGIEEIEDGAFANVADVLNEVPAFGQGQTPWLQQSTDTVGQSFVNYLGFGTQRTLTLVNGRRFVSAHSPLIDSSGLEVDMNVIPTALVERVETIGVGGAPIYGSDAMAGTVNIILKDRFEGVELRLRRGTTEAGGGDSREVSLVAGTNFADSRGNLTMSVESHRQDGLVFADRPQYVFNDPTWSDPEPRNPADPDSDLVRRIVHDLRLNLFSDGGLIDPFGFTAPSFGIGAMQDGNFWQFDSYSNLVPFTPGSPFPGPFIFALGGDGSDYFDRTSQIRSPLHRDNFVTRFSYDLTDNVTFSADALLSDTWSDRIAAQSTVLSWATGSAMRFPADHPFLHPDARDLLAGMGANEFWLHRNNDDVSIPSAKRDQFLWHVTAGLDGKFASGERNFFWSIWATHGETDADTAAEEIIGQRFLNAAEVRRLTADDLAAIDADPTAAENAILGFSGTASAGVDDIVCEAAYKAALGSVAVVDSDLYFVRGCVPLNLFGEGVRSRAARDWVTEDMMSRADIEQVVLNLNFGGDLLRLPAGWASFNLGFEGRDESAYWIPGPVFRLGIGSSPPQLPTGGTYDTREYYGELVLPLIQPNMGLPLVQFAELSGAVRVIDHSTAGTDTVWTAGLRIAPVRDLSFRGNYTESVRAPSLAELFAPPTIAYAGGLSVDPCDYRNVDGGEVPATRRTNCAADIPDYDPNSWVSNVSSPAIVGLGTMAGNPDLVNESASSWAIGLTYEPRWAENLLVTVDYINVELRDAIDSVGLGWLLRSCYDSTGFPVVPTCDRFVRDESGAIVDFTGGPFNAATGEYESLQLAASHRFDVAELLSRFSSDWRSHGLGLFETRIRLDHPLKRSYSLAGEPSPNFIGGATDPEWSGTFDFIWSGRNARVFWRTLWQDEALLDLNGETLYEDLQGNLIYAVDYPVINNVTFSYSLGNWFRGGPDEMTIQLAIGNVFNAGLDVYQHASEIPSTAVLFGRNYTLTLQGNW